MLLVGYLVEAAMTRVMICEDDPIQAIDLAYAVESCGGEVCACVRSSVEALAAARQTAPDVSLIDLTLADGETGIDLAIEIAKTGCRVIVLTGSAHSPAKLGGIRHSFVSKPISNEIVAELLRMTGTDACSPPRERRAAATAVAGTKFVSGSVGPAPRQQR